MASIIAAGTTSGTSISVSGDTSGQLVLQTNGTTTAVTISTGQVVTLAQPLPVASGGSGVTTSTGTGAVVLGTSPTMATPTFNSAQLATVVGTAPLYMARAWVNFNGVGTVAINASGNVSSITDNGTGDFTVNFTTAMSDANYTIAGSAGNGTVGVSGAATSILHIKNDVGGAAIAAGSIRVHTSYGDGANVDYPTNCLAIFR